MTASAGVVSLEDKYLLDTGSVLMTGTQALVRLPLDQRRRDRLAGLETAGFISGYRGSPLGGYDRELWQAQAHLQAQGILFRPGVNEDLAATAVWGTQQISQFAGAYDGVFSLWYGKGPGIERSGDALKHGNYSGASPHGGVVIAFGDDHAAKSSTIAHQSEQTLAAHSIPVLYPANVREILEYGLAGWALSRFSGLWVGLKCVNETLETAATVPVAADRPGLTLPEHVVSPPGGVNYQPLYSPTRDDILVTRHRLPRVKLFVRQNRLDSAVFHTPAPRLGILTAGKAYADVLYALRLLCIDERRARELRLDVYKVGMIWPLEDSGLREFAAGLEELLTVEEKRPFLEQQAATILYPLPQRPRILGKFDEQGRALLPADVSLSPTAVAVAIGERLQRLGLDDAALRSRLTLLQQRVSAGPAGIDNDRPTLDQLRAGSVRTPYFCSGCPHNTSTRVPEGSKAFAGIGCHTMALRMGRETLPPTHMGGEGANWIGIEPFVATKHVFQNMGDGTYFHSGLMAIRAAVSARSNITYKILFNSVVAMTGGQPIDGPLSVAEIARQVLAEGVARCVVVSSTPSAHRGSGTFPRQVPIYARDQLDRVQRELRDTPGVTVLIYEQICAAEKRRRVKRGDLPKPTRRVLINEKVCEGCGDCSIQANCLSIRPKETALGRKRTIDQSSCNEDLSCVKGFCPSFVIVEGARPRRPDRSSAATQGQSPPPPPARELVGPYNVIIAGIGGTGVITIGTILAMAAHLEGKGAGTYNMTGLAQKGGPVYSHLRFVDRRESLIAGRVDVADADLIIACDLLAALGSEALQTVDFGRTRAVVNSGIEPPASFQLFKDSELPGAGELHRFTTAVGDENVFAVEATALASEQMGDTIAANMFMVGYTHQLGWLPVSLDSVLRAIELNGVAVQFNRQALEMGRQAAARRAAPLVAPLPIAASPGSQPPLTLEAVVEDRRRRLVEYQNDRYAQRYASRMAAVREAERVKAPGCEGFALAVAHNYARLMMYKDEYEVARLYNGFREELARSFDGSRRLKVLLAPPALFGAKTLSEEPRKRAFGPWVFTLFRVLALLKGLRGTPLDPFGGTKERRMERSLIAAYETLLDELLASLTPENHSHAIKLASLPEQIRGFGHVKVRATIQAQKIQDALLREFRMSGKSNARTGVA